MAAETGEKTEPATPRRRSEARAKGQVARSQDLVGASLLLVGFVTIKQLGPGLWEFGLAVMEGALRWDSAPTVSESLILAGALVQATARQIAPLMILLFLAAVVVLFAQIGWLFTWHPITPSLGRLNPLQGVQRLFSVRSWGVTAIGLVKLFVVSVIAYLTIASKAAEITFALTVGAETLVRLAGLLVYQLGFRISLALLVLGLLDWWWQRFRLERDLRMTKEEVKDELRSMEGDPLIRRRQRQLQMQFALQRLRKDVPKADVVVTNPTHFAVAIAYDPKTMFAPKVVAKGADEMALRIRQIAAEYGIPLVERKAVARALYEVVEVGHFVPERFYQAIAEILAYVYALTGRGLAKT